MVCDIPLSPEERRFAEENHDLVYQFLNKNGLSMDEHYDIAVFGYLRAVQRYFAEPALRKYNFSTIAAQNMQRECFKHDRAMSRAKKHISESSLDDAPFGSLPNIPPSVSSHYSVQDLEMQLLLHALAEKVSQQQMTIVRMRTEGYALREIARAQNLSLYFVRKLLEEVRMVLTRLCEE